MNDGFVLRRAWADATLMVIASVVVNVLRFSTENDIV